MTSITTGSLQTFGRTFGKSPAFASAASRAVGVRCHPSPPSTITIYVNDFFFAGASQRVNDKQWKPEWFPAKT